MPARRRGAAYAIEWTVVSWQNDAVESSGHSFPCTGPVHSIIIQGLSSTDPVVRAHLMGALFGLHDDPAFDKLALGHIDEDFEVRIAAANLMRRHWFTWMHGYHPGIEPIEKALLALANSKEVRARRAAIEALQHVAGPAAEATVLAALKDEDRIVRVTASLSLEQIGTPKALYALVALLGSKDDWARRAAAYTLEIGPFGPGVAILIKALQAPDEEVVRLAIFTLGEVGPAGAAAIPALEKMGGTNAREALQKIRKK